MGFAAWTRIDWVGLLQDTGIIASLLFAGLNFRADSRDRKIQNMLALTSAHRDIWSALYAHPNFGKIFRDEATGRTPLFASDSELFIHFLILHLGASYRAHKLGMYFEEDGLRHDIREFFSLPATKAVWQKSRVYQDRDFVKFVESTLTG
jgi:hypothetical protein